MSDFNRLERRRFLKKTSLGIAAATGMYMLGKLNWIMPQAYAEKWKGFASKPPAGVKLADPKNAKKFRDYQHFAKKYKGKKIRKLYVGSNCENCSFFKVPKANKNWKKCSVLTNHYVYREGICSMYNPKPKFKKTAVKA